MLLCDYHVHTRFCDGNDEPSAIAKRAYELGFSYLGFSRHGFFEFKLDKSFELIDNEYKNAISALKEEYGKKGLTIFTGAEVDYISEEKLTGYDYTIGSVHYLSCGGKELTFDTRTPDMIYSMTDEYFDGSFDKLAEAYFARVGSLFDKRNFDIIGHFDLISKFAEKENFRLTDKYYLAGFEAIDRLLKSGKPFEINTGAIARGYRKTPYPSRPFLEYIRKKGGKIVITGDCHSQEHLGRYNSLGVKFARDCGFDSRMILTEMGWVEIDLFA